MKEYGIPSMFNSDRLSETCVIFFSCILECRRTLHWLRRDGPRRGVKQGCVKSSFVSFIVIDWVSSDGKKHLTKEEDCDGISPLYQKSWTMRMISQSYEADTVTSRRRHPATSHDIGKAVVLWLTSTPAKPRPCALTAERTTHLLLVEMSCKILKHSPTSAQCQISKTAWRQTSPTKIGPPYARSDFAILQLLHIF